MPVSALEGVDRRLSESAAARSGAAPCSNANRSLQHCAVIEEEDVIGRRRCGRHRSRSGRDRLANFRRTRTPDHGAPTTPASPTCRRLPVQATAPTPGRPPWAVAPPPTAQRTERMRQKHRSRPSLNRWLRISRLLVRRNAPVVPSIRNPRRSSDRVGARGTDEGNGPVAGEALETVRQSASTRRAGRRRQRPDHPGVRMNICLSVTMTLRCRTEASR